MMTLNTDRNAIGDAHCLNCGRALAQVVRNPGDGTLNLLPAVNQATVQVIVAGRRLLRCRRYGGRAFVELWEETPIEELAPSMASPGQVEEEPVLAAAAPRGPRSLGWRVASRDRPHRHASARSLG